MAHNSPPQERELIVLRHAKSSWDRGAGGDFERPLAPRGERDARRMAAWFASLGFEPDHLLCSPAERALATARLILEELDLEEDLLQLDVELYLAGLETLLDALATCPGWSRRVLLVGHNPGVENLVAFLNSGSIEIPEGTKGFPTAAAAHFQLPGSWSTLERGAGRLLHFVRPRELPR